MNVEQEFKEKIISKDLFNKYFKELNKNNLSIVLDKHYAYALAGYFSKNISDFSTEEIEKVFKSEKIVSSLNANIFVLLIENALNRGKPLPLINNKLIKSSKSLDGVEKIYAQYMELCLRTGLKSDKEQVVLLFAAQGKNIAKCVIENSNDYSSDLKKIMLALYPYRFKDIKSTNINVFDNIIDEYGDITNFSELKKFINLMSTSLKNKFIKKHVEKILKNDEDIKDNISETFFIHYVFELSLQDKEKCINFISERKNKYNGFDINCIQDYIINEKLHIDKLKLESIFNEFKDIILEPCIQKIGIAEEKEDFILSSLRNNKYKLCNFLNPIINNLEESDKKRLVELNINYFLTDLNGNITKLLRVINEKDLYLNYKEKINHFLDAEMKRLEDAVQYSMDSRKEILEEKRDLLDVIFNKVELELSLSSNVKHKTKIGKV